MDINTIINNKYFTNDFTKSIWESTYKFKTDKNIEDTWHRVAKYIASVEKPEKRNEIEDKFYRALQNFKLVPGGRILSNAGTDYKNTSLINCFVSPRTKKYPQDSIDGIYEVLKMQANTLKSEGGWGLNFSFIRPRGTYINGIGVNSPGSVCFMDIFDASSGVITSGDFTNSGNKEGLKKKIRKGAMMAICECWHPDIEEFIEAKSNTGKLKRFNISIGIRDDFMNKLEAVMKARSEHNLSSEDLKKLDEWDLIFPDVTFEKYDTEWDGDIQLWKNKGYPIHVYKTVSITKLWDKIMTATYNHAEPGVLFLDTINKKNPVSYIPECKIRTSNPCGEQVMGDANCCDLASINLTQLVKDDGTFDFDELVNIAKIGVRFLDNVIEVANVPLPEYDYAIKNYRRIGLGIMGLGSAIAMLGMKFNSLDASDFIADVMSTYTTAAVDESIEIAKEKGMFPACDPEKHSECIFLTKHLNLPTVTLNQIKKYGIRNSTLFSIQPTGNTGILANIVSGGLEPIFATQYIRTVTVVNIPEHIKEKCPKFWIGDYTPNEYFKEYSEGNDKLLRYIDEDGTVYKIDKTRGLVKEVECKDYSLVYLEKHNRSTDHIQVIADLSVEDHLKSLTVISHFLDSACSKTINCPADYPYNKFKNVYYHAWKNGVVGVTTYRAGTMTAVLSTKEDKKKDCDCSEITFTDAVKRPRTLDCDVYNINIKGVKYYAVVSLLGGKPYEVFVGNNINSENGNINIPSTITNGQLTKQARGHYILKSGDFVYDIINKATSKDCPPEIEAISRLTSTSLRHGVSIEFIVQQLEKTGGDVMSYTKVMVRVLKKYIPNNTTVSGEVCPKCGKSLVRIEGCKTCPSCGYSMCG